MTQKPQPASLPHQLSPPSTCLRCGVYPTFANLEINCPTSSNIVDLRFSLLDEATSGRQIAEHTSHSAHYTSTMALIDTSSTKGAMSGGPTLFGLPMKQASLITVRGCRPGVCPEPYVTLILMALVTVDLPKFRPHTCTLSAQCSRHLPTPLQPTEPRAKLTMRLLVRSCTIVG